MQVVITRLANQRKLRSVMVKQFLFIIIGIVMALGISVLPEKFLKDQKVMMGVAGVIFYPASDCIIYTRCKRGEELD